MSSEKFERDSELGAALGDSLNLHDQEEFVANVMVAARGHGLVKSNWVDLLNRWSVPGMIAAAAVAVLALAASRFVIGADGTLAEELAVNETNSALTEDIAPLPEVILAAYVDARR